VEFFKPDKVIVLVTEEAEKSEDFTNLQEELGALLEKVSIPSGKSEKELWDIFDCLADRVQSSDEVILDVTHAFRSLPLFSFGVAVYLRRVYDDISVSRIVYGAYEARKENRSPVFDLTPLLDLMDWTSGCEFFLRRSDAEILAQRLRESQSRFWRKKNDVSAEAFPRRLNTVAQKLRILSGALHLGRLREVMGTAHDILPLLKEVAYEAEHYAKPFRRILDEIKREVEDLAYENPDVLDKKNLERQLKMIEYCYKKGLVVQAVTTAREWMVNWLLLKKGEMNWLNRDIREKVEEELNCEAKLFISNKTGPKYADIWDRLRVLRNDVAHCGMNENPSRIDRILMNAEEIIAELKELLKEIKN